MAMAQSIHHDDVLSVDKHVMPLLSLCQHNNTDSVIIPGLSLYFLFPGVKNIIKIIWLFFSLK